MEEETPASCTQDTTESPHTDDPRVEDTPADALTENSEGQVANIVRNSVNATESPHTENEAGPRIEDATTGTHKENSEGDSVANMRNSVAEVRKWDRSKTDMKWAQFMLDAVLRRPPQETSMDDTVWSQIPDEVLIRVLSFLLLRMLFQVRVVCKRWSNIIRSSEFNKMCLDVGAPAMAPHPAICYVNNRLGFRWAMYDNLERQWQLMPDFNSRSEEDRMKKREIYVASKGLLCLLEIGDIDTIKSLTIWNPLTNHEQELPEILSSWSFPLARIMFHDEKTNSYKLLLSGNQNYHPEDERYSATEIYDSAQGAWSQGGKLLPSLRFPFSNGVICNGAVYYFASRPMTMYDILLMYNIEHNQWSEIDHIVPANTYCTPYLFECDGNLLTVMHLLSAPPARIASCAIFLLDFGTNEWKMHVQMPHRMYMDFVYIGGCVASDAQLFVTGIAPNREVIVAVYAHNEHDWFWLPPCPVASSVDLIERHSTFGFHPSLID